MPDAGVGARIATAMDATTIPTAAPAAAPADFESLLAPVVERAYGTALRLAGNRDDAQDLVQEAALLAFRGFGGFRAGTNFRAWFFRILLNCFYASRRRRRPEQSLEALEEAQPLVHLFVQSRAAGMHGPGRDPAREVLDRIAAEDVERAVQSLPEEFRVACTLYFMEDFSYQEIADVVGIPVGTVRSRLHRGRKLLQRRLWQAAIDAGLAATTVPGPMEGDV
jgi:RNA polymerase sigma-70 factor (ECF subfamily)